MNNNTYANIERRVRAIAFVFTAALAATPAWADVSFVSSDSDGTCPTGYVLASASEARQDPEAACNALGEWYIARLAGGGSMDGPGYKCKIRDTDTRSLGNSLCRGGTAASYGNVSSCFIDTLMASTDAAANVGTWKKGADVVASRPNFSSVSGGYANEAFAQDAAKNYCKGKGYDWALPQLKLNSADPHMDVQCCSRLSPQNSSAPENLTEFVGDVVTNSSEIRDITKAESLADIFLLAKDLGHEVSQSQLSDIAQNASRKRRASSCGGFGEPACSKCTESVTVYFPFNACCFPMYSECVEHSDPIHCDDGLINSDGQCEINQNGWVGDDIDNNRKEANCGGPGQKNCWQYDDQNRDHLQMDTAKLNFVTVLGPEQRALPSGTRFIYVYRKQDNKIVLRNYDRDNRAYIFPGNCRQNSQFGVYSCDEGNIKNGRYLHVRHTQLNHAPNTPDGNNWDPVWCAGEMRIENGEICLVNNESGHFKPLASCTSHVVQTLQAWDVPTSSWLVDGSFNDYSAGTSCSTYKDEL